MHGRWFTPVRSCFTQWSWVVLVMVFAVSAKTMSPKVSGPKVRTYGTEEDEARDELEEIKERILSDLGLTTVPDVSKANISSTEMDRMLELYHQSVLESELEEMDSENESILLRFYSDDDKESSVHTIFHSNNNTRTIFFPLHKNPSLRREGYYLKSAKLRVPMIKGWPTPRILIYRLLENPFSPNSSRALVISQVMDSMSEQHAEVDVSDTVRHWFDHPQMNYSLLFECQGCWNASATTAAFQESPVLEVLLSEFPVRVKRSNQILPDMSSTEYLDCTKGFRTRKCCRRSLKVSFKKIGWNWIIQPKEFEAYFCKGKCPHRASNFANTHALLQSMLYHKGYNVPRPCCAPRKLRTLTLLHYNDKVPPEVVITKRKGMIVKECACS